MTSQNAAEKFFKEILKNLLTKVEGRGIIVELRVKKTCKGSLKIEQQEISTKRKSKCESRRKF